MRIGAAFGVIALSSPAVAQLIPPEAPTGSHIPLNALDFPVDRSREVLHRFAECSVGNQLNLAHEMLLDINAIVGKQYKKLLKSQCLVEATSYEFGTVVMKMTGPLYRFAVADLLAARSLGGIDPGSLRLAAPLEKLKLDPADYKPPKCRLSGKSGNTCATDKLRDDGLAALLGYGECTVRADPHGARRLLATELNSDEELAALRSMLPAFSSCLDQGKQFKADRLTLRGTIALNYYRLAYAPKSPASLTSAKQ